MLNRDLSYFVHTISFLLKLTNQFEIILSDNWKVSFQLYRMNDITKISNTVDIFEREYNKIKVSNSLMANIK